MTSIFNNVTVEQFKSYYERDFAYLPLFRDNATYWRGDVVYYNDNFYMSLADDNTDAPTDTTKWRKIKGNVYDYVTDNDIMKAYGQALANSSTRFGATSEEKIIIFLHLMAFYLVMDMQNANVGIASSYSGFIASKSVDGVSESYNFPTWLTDSPIYSMFSSNGYGLKYLSLILPYLACPMLFSVGDSTNG